MKFKSDYLISSGIAVATYVGCRMYGLDPSEAFIYGVLVGCAIGFLIVIYRMWHE